MGPYLHTRLERDLTSRLRDLENGACTCARADASHIRHVQISYLMGPYSHTKFERNSPSRLRDLENGVCTCARADALHLRHVQSSYLMGPYLHTKFERNRPSRLRDMKEGCARAHVPIHSTPALCKRNSYPVSKHTPNLNVIGLAVVELSRAWCLRHPLTQHVPRAVVGTGVYRCRSNTKLIGW